MPENSPRLYRAGQGEPLVLVHGFTGTWRMWLPQLADLVTRFDVIAPTLHGHDGGPPAPEAARSIGDAADHLEALLDEHGVGTAHFAGNSMGGALSLEMAKRGRARSVVAISPGGGWEEGDSAETERIIRWFQRTRKLGLATERRAPRMMRNARMRRFGFRDVMCHGELVPPEEAVGMLRSSLRCSVLDDVFATIRSGGARVVDLDRIECPVLLVWGDRDRILPMSRHSNRFRREIPGVEWRMLAGAGHSPMYDEQGLLTSLIGDFAERAASLGEARSAASA